MDRKIVFKDFVDELGNAFDFYDEGWGSTIGDPCFISNLDGNDIIPELTVENFDSVMVFINNFTI